jgi:hypothetical protein
MSLLRGGPERRMAIFRLGVVLTAGIAISGCGDGVSPSLSGFRYDGPSPDSATVLLLSTEFHDDDGDLSGGFLESFVDGRPTGAGLQELLPIFLLSEVAQDATDGRLQFVLELSASADEPPAGASFRLGIRVTDAAGHASATSEIRLRVQEPR